MRLATCVIGVALLVLAARPGGARADDAVPSPSSYRAVIDRVDLERASIGGLRLRVELSALAIGGQLLPLGDPKSIRLMVGGGKLEPPLAHGIYGATGEDAAIVFVIQANLAYAEALPIIASSLDDVVLSKLGDRTQVAIMAYGDATDAGKLGSLKAARGKLGQISQDGSVGDPALLDTLDRAMRLLRKARAKVDGAPLRKLIVVIGDGRDRAGDRDRTTQLGVRADRDGIRIHTFGFASSNIRRPLLTLGELAKRSLGTFRWVRTGGAESWTPAFQQLLDEIDKQHVLTYFLPADADVAGRKLKIVLVGRTEATSNELKIPEARCGREACAGYCVGVTCVIPHEAARRGVFGWLVLVIGIAVAAAVVLGGIGFLLQRQQRAALGGPLPAGQFPPGQLGATGQPAMAPPGSKSPKSRSKPLRNQPVAPPAPAVGPALLVMTGPHTGQRIPLLHGFTIGKAPTSHLVLDDGYTSTYHAQIVVDQAGTFRLYDSNSTNGTFINGVRMNDVVLEHGMSIRIGSTELRFLAQ